MSNDYTSYQVPGQQLRYRVAQLNAAGIPFNVVGQQAGVYIIVVPMAYANGLDQLPQPQHRRKPWWMPNKRGLVALAMIAVVGLGAYMVLSGGITIKGVSVAAVKLPTVEMPDVKPPTVEMPTISNPFDGVQRSLDATTTSINRTAEAAKNAAITFMVIVGGLFSIGALWALRGPIGFVGRGLGGAVQALGKAVKRG